MLLATVVSAQSLGEAARKNRSQKKRVAARVYTDEDLASNVTYNNGAASGPVDAEKSATDGEKKEADSSAPPDAQEKVAADWKAQFAEQKNSISLLEREVDVLQREYRQRIALYYADAGNQLRDSKAWAEEQRKYDGNITAKQQELSEARQRLEDMKEEARKAGMPSSISE
jgi:hypothetical protein